MILYVNKGKETIGNMVITVFFWMILFLFLHCLHLDGMSVIYIIAFQSQMSPSIDIHFVGQYIRRFLLDYLLYQVSFVFFLYPNLTRLRLAGKIYVYH